MSGLLAVARIFAEGTAPTSYGIGIDANTILTEFFTVVAANIPAILTLFGAMFAINWVLRRANKASKGKLG